MLRMRRASRPPSMKSGGSNRGTCAGGGVAALSGGRAVRRRRRARPRGPRAEKPASMGAILSWQAVAALEAAAMPDPLGRDGVEADVDLVDDAGLGKPGRGGGLLAVLPAHVERQQPLVHLLAMGDGDGGRARGRREQVELVAHAATPTVRWRSSSAIRRP